MNVRPNAYMQSAAFISVIRQMHRMLCKIYLSGCWKSRKYFAAGSMKKHGYTVARNHCRDILRSGWRKKRIDLGNSLQEKLEHEKIAEEDSNECIEQALRKLPVKQKEVLYLYYYEEYSIKEMSALLHRKESTIQSQLAAGRRKLKKQLVKGGMVDEPKICKSNE